MEQLTDLEVEKSTDENHITVECIRVVHELVNIGVPKLSNNIEQFQCYLVLVGQKLS